MVRNRSSNLTQNETKGLLVAFWSVFMSSSPLPQGGPRHALATALQWTSTRHASAASGRDDALRSQSPSSCFRAGTAASSCGRGGRLLKQLMFPGGSLDKGVDPSSTKSNHGWRIWPSWAVFGHFWAAFWPLLTIFGGGEVRRPAGRGTQSAGM